MIAQRPPAAPPGARPRWQESLAGAVRSVDELLAILGLEPAVVGAPEPVAAALRQFPLRVPRSFVARMRPGDPDDPLLRQVLPVSAETREVPGFGVDPLAERASLAGPGLLHKYAGRVLLVLTGACAVHCRYCFRRHFPYAEQRVDAAALDAAVAYVAGDPSVREVILSGGDPLSLPDAPLAELAARLRAIPHLRRLRLHTRQPIVLPDRVDEGLLAWFASPALAPLAPVMVVHVNHAREIDDEVRAALALLREAGVQLLNQTVLLRGVNDTARALAELSEALFAAGVLPYYLNLLDRVSGSAHFEIPEREARALVAALRATLPGYLVPRLVREVPGAPSKVPVPG